MPIIELTDDEFEILRDAFNDVGCDCPGVDWDKFKALGVKLGFWEADKPPTEEELKRNEELRNSPAGKMMTKIFSHNNSLIDKFLEDIPFYQGEQWTTRSDLKIKLPYVYNIKDKI